MIQGGPEKLLLETIDSFVFVNHPVQIKTG